MSKPKRSWGLTFAAIVLIVFAAPVLLNGIEGAIVGQYVRASARILQGIVVLASGVLILLHHKNAVRVTLVCAILFTVACIFHGLIMRDVVFEIIEIALIWIGFTWYAQWRTRIDTSIPVAPVPEMPDTRLK